MNNYVAPSVGLSAFNCPLCKAYAKQVWAQSAGKAYDGRYFIVKGTFLFSTCEHCGDSSFWKAPQLVYPTDSTASFPNADMPKNVMDDYEEARQIVSASPRGAAALLRLGLQKLCVHLGGKGQNLNEDIGDLVKKGLPEKIQKALDAVRVIGNNAVHPGTIDLNDDAGTALKLFGFINVICEVMITQPKQIDDFYSLKIPTAQKEQILKRDR